MTEKKRESKRMRNKDEKDDEEKKKKKEGWDDERKKHIYVEDRTKKTKALNLITHLSFLTKWRAMVDNTLHGIH